MTLSTRRSRRSKRDIEPTEPLLTFQLRQQWFALPLAVVRKVMAREQQADPTTLVAPPLTEPSITLLDVDRCIFSESAPVGSPDHTGCLAILETPDGQPLGLPLDSQPKLRRVPVSQLMSFVTGLEEQCELKGVLTIIKLQEEPFQLFLLDPEYLQTDDPEKFKQESSVLIDLLNEFDDSEWPLD